MQLDPAMHIFLHDHGLVGVRGGEFVGSAFQPICGPHDSLPETAQFALDKLSPSARELSLGHNHLGSEGVIHLFTRLKELRREWATSGIDGEDRPWGIEKITLSSNEIQSDALVAIADYLEGDETLKELYLPHNRIRVGVA
jgi:hypothetical protein